MLRYTGQPSGNIIECFCLAYVVGNYDAVRLLVKCLRHRVESLMTSGVPNLNCDHLPLFCGVLFRYEVQPKSALVVVIESIVVIPLDDRSLPYGGVSQNNYLHLFLLRCHFVGDFIV